MTADKSVDAENAEDEQKGRREIRNKRSHSVPLAN
jgi:hypothetical protein